MYIVDKSLIRFGKFIGAGLTLFALVGGVFWGFDINKASDRVRDAAEDVRKAQADIREMELKIRESQEEIQNTRQKILETAKSVEANKKEVESSERQAQEVLAKSQQEARELVNAIKKDAGVAHRYTQLLIQRGPDLGVTIRTSTSEVKGPPFTVPEIAKHYDFPTDFDGKGQTIGLIELGGGYSEFDLDSYFAWLKLPRPKVTTVPVQGVRNQPGRAADAQVTLDIEIAGAVAPGAHIVVYSAPSTKSGFLDAVTTAIHDAANRPSVLCISWGSTESTWSSDMLKEMNDAFQTAATLGMTVVAATATDVVTDGEDPVNFPASSPYVLAVGGTHLVMSGSNVTSEVGWNYGSRGAAKAGSSAVFPRPDWQSRVNVPVRKGRNPGRGIPDVAANAAPESGYLIIFQGQAQQIGGTATSSPLWAGLIALVNQGAARKIGYINPLLYNKLGPDGVLRDITEGGAAAPGWDPCTGWGSPNGRKLLAAFRLQ
jgi:kumamolisin